MPETTVTAQPQNVKLQHQIIRVERRFRGEKTSREMLKNLLRAHYDDL